MKKDYNPLRGYTHNVVSYYFSKAKYLEENNRLPEAEKLLFAPEIFPENVPPLSAYFSAYSFKFFKPFLPGEFSFYSWVMLNPIVLFVISAIFGFFAFANIFKNWLSGLFFVLLLATAPFAIDLGRWGYYTEENLGVLLSLIALFFLIKAYEKEKAISLYSVAAILSLTALFLTWQQFPVIIIGIAALALLNFRDKKIILKSLAFLIIPLVLGHLVTYYLMHSGYSPFLMLKESYLGIINYRADFLKTAMRRSNWRNLNLSDFIKGFGLISWVLIFFGSINVFANFQKIKYQVIFIFSLFTFVTTLFFFKSRYLALPFILVLVVSGLTFFFDKKAQHKLKQIGQTIFIFLGKAQRFIKKYLLSFSAVLKRYWIIPFCVFLAILSIFSVNYWTDSQIKKATELLNLSQPLSQPLFSKINLANNLEIGKWTEVNLELKNIGGDSLAEPAAFSGIHIEIENAEVKDIAVYGEETGAQYIIKKNAQEGDIFWFEAKFQRLKRGASGFLWFKIKPNNLPVNIWYRGWIPGPCSLENREEAIRNLRLEYANWKNSWRNEKCIKRTPTNDDFLHPVCKIKVYAAHPEWQDFRCFKKEIK